MHILVALVMGIGHWIESGTFDTFAAVCLSIAAAFIIYPFVALKIDIARSRRRSTVQVEEMGFFSHTFYFLGFLITNLWSVLLGFGLIWIIIFTLLYIGLSESPLISSLASFGAFVLTTSAWIFNYRKKVREDKLANEAKIQAELKKEEEARVAKEAKIQAELKENEEQKKRVKLEAIGTVKKKANERTKTKASANGYITNPKWETREKTDLIREYGFQRFMFPPTITNPKKLASKLSKDAEEAKLDKAIIKLQPLYSAAPLIEYWFEYHSEDWLIENAKLGNNLPQKINFSQIAEQCGFTRLSYRAFALAIECLFQEKIIHETSNLDKTTAASLFIQDILKTPSNGRFRKYYAREGIKVTAKVSNMDYDLPEPYLLFKASKN